MHIHIYKDHYGKTETQLQPQLQPLHGHEDKWQFKSLHCADNDEEASCKVVQVIVFILFLDTEHNSHKIKMKHT